MISMNPVSPSRDGDQFHYIRGAQLSLSLLNPDSDLVAVSIEGVPSSDDSTAGVEVIDLGLFYGSTEIEKARRIHYRQFKHSTLRPDTPMTSSDLKKTLVGFAERYASLAEKLSSTDIADRFRFEFETNRPIAESVSTAIKELCEGVEGSKSKYLRQHLPLEGETLKQFAKLIRLIPLVPDFLSQRKMLARDTRAYLPDADRDAPLQLLNLVTTKATSEGANERAIKHLDVLQALGVRFDDLYPAEPRFDPVENVLVRKPARELAQKIIDGSDTVIVQADGGIGKSVFAQQLHSLMPGGSKAFVYDCFGAGSYRALSKYRHRARDVAVQIANEMSSAGLCDPLIPTTKADDTAFCRAFLARIGQASEQLAANPDALLLIVLDAADNSEAAAREARQGHSFARMLLRERFPENVRLVLTARPHRVETLAPPVDAVLLDLPSFSESETAENLRGRGVIATRSEVKEFHRLTSQNPRVQAVALEQGGAMREVLGRLGTVPLSVEDTIEALLERAVSNAKDAGGSAEAEQIEQICSALAILRPFVPLKLVADTAGVSEGLVRSFANDLKGPLLIREDAVQFRDEPTEHWFQQQFRPQGTTLNQFIDRLRPLTAKSAYAAAVLPQMMLEAGQLEELVEITLKGKALPKNNELARRDVEMQRLQFALKAAIQAERFKDAATLSMKAGGNAAVEERQQLLIGENTDLASRFLEPNQILEMISRREIQGGDWMGSDHAYRAALLSVHPGLAGDASKELRFTHSWLEQWAAMVRDGKENIGSPTDEDRAAMLFAELNLNGPDDCAVQLRRWKHREVSFRTGRLLARRLIDAGRFEDLDHLSTAAGNDLGLILAITFELSLVSRLPPKATIARAIQLVASRHIKVSPPSDYRGEETLVLVMAQLVVAAAKYKLLPRRKLATVLGRYLPKVPPPALFSRFRTDQGRRFAYLRAYSVRAALRSETVKQAQVAEPKFKKLLKGKGYQSDGDLTRFKQQTAALLPWHKLWCDFELGRIQECQLGKILSETACNSAKAEDRLYGERSAVADEIASIWSTILSDGQDPSGWQSLADWRDSLKYPLPLYISVKVTRRAARSGNAAVALDWASYAANLHAPVREDAESKAAGFLSISRAIFVASEADAKNYFDEAVKAGADIGQENLFRWSALIELALASRMDGFDDPELAYAFSRAAELTEQHDSSQKYFDWDGTVRALAAISPRSVPAILSRWADRRFGEQERLAPAAFLDLAREEHLAGISCFALLPFRWRWDYPDLLKLAFGSAKGAAHLSEIESLFLRYAQHLRLSSREWSRIADECSDAGLSPQFAHKQMAQMELRESIEKHRTKDHYPRPNASAQKPQNVDLADIDWTTAAEIHNASERFRSEMGWLEPSRFFAAAIEATPVGKEPPFFEALDESGLVHLYDLSSLLSTVPVSWRSRPAVNASLDQLILSTFKRNCFSVEASNLFQVLSLEEAVAGSGLTKQELASEVVKAIASSSVDRGSHAMFRLAGLLAILLDPAEAKNALVTTLEFYDQFHDAEDGDGQWSPALEPPENVSEGLAGYIFAALGSPEPSRRWEATHCIYLLAAVGDKEMLQNIVSFAVSGHAKAFHGNQLFFYELNAQQWLMIGLARSALDFPEAVVAVADYLRSKATRSNKHVLIRHFAAKALRELARNGLLSLEAAEASQLSTINEGILPAIDKADHGYPPDHAVVERKYEDARFHFDIDFPKSYMSPLAGAFGLYDAEIEIEAERVIVDDWGLSFSGHYAEDERAKRGFFRDYSRRSRHSVQADDLDFYLSYHATMEVAGALLERLPAYENPTDPLDDYRTYTGWLGDQLLVRSDGYWLFDRRDPRPAFEDIDWAAEKDEDWLAAIKDYDVQHIAYPSAEKVAIWGYWTERNDRREQTVMVRSALVSPLSGGALVRSAKDQGRYDFALPSYEDFGEIDEAQFVLKGWITEEGRYDGLDANDPWAAQMSKRVDIPHPEFRELLKIEPKDLGRVWVSEEGELFWSEIWADEEEGSWRQAGDRLLASRTALQKLSASTKLSLVLEVFVERRINRREYERSIGSDSSNSLFKRECFLLENEDD